MIFEKPTKSPGLVVQGRDDDVGPKLRAVLADPPALVLEPAFGLGDLEFVGGPTPVDGLLRVEAGEVLADDLVGLVPLDALGPGVPRGDVALRVEQEDGVVLGPFHQEPEPLLAPAQGFLGLLACGQVTGDFREAMQVALPVPQGRDDDVGPKLRAVLAHPPALVLEPALGCGDLEFVGGPAPVDGLLRVEAWRSAGR